MNSPRAPFEWEQGKLPDGDLPDEFSHQGDVSEGMAAIGALVLLRYTEDLGRLGAVHAARRMFSAMRALEVRERGQDRKCGE